MNERDALAMVEEAVGEAGFIYHEYKENGKVCGAECEAWTSDGGDVIVFLDMRGKDITDLGEWADEAESYYNDFEPECETEIHLNCPGNPGMTSMLESFTEFKNNDLIRLAKSIGKASGLQESGTLTLVWKNGESIYDRSDPIENNNDVVSKWLSEALKDCGRWGTFGEEGDSITVEVVES